MKKVPLYGNSKQRKLDIFIDNLKAGIGASFIDFSLGALLLTSNFMWGSIDKKDYKGENPTTQMWLMDDSKKQDEKIRRKSLGNAGYE